MKEEVSRILKEIIALPDLYNLAELIGELEHLEHEIKKIQRKNVCGDTPAI